MALIDQANRRLGGFHVLKGAEVDIRADGTLDLGETTLGRFDIVIASVHSGFKQSREQITGRFLSAIRHPSVSVIAHPTGRLIGEREAYDVDLEAVLREAAKFGVAVELNAYPVRLDLNDGNLRLAKEYGAPVVINTDSHVTTQLDFMEYGIHMARRGWVEKKDVLNALPYDRLVERLQTCREKKTRATSRKAGKRTA